MSNRLSAPWKEQRQLVHELTLPNPLDAKAKRAPRLRHTVLERDKTAVRWFNGIAFAVIEPHWIAYFKVESDPVEYQLCGISAQTQRQAHSLALIRLRDAGIDVRKD